MLPFAFIEVHDFAGMSQTHASSFVLQGQSDLLRGAKMDSLDALRQLALACEACGLTSSSSSSNSSSSNFSTAELHYSSHPLSGRRSSTHGNGRIWDPPAHPPTPRVQHTAKDEKGLKRVITEDSKQKKKRKTWTWVCKATD